MEESINKIFLKIKSLIREYSSKFVFSLGMGGLLAIYIIELCRMKVIPVLKETEDLYEIFVNLNIVDINVIEIYIIAISIVAIISSPLLSKKDLKRSYEVFFLITVFVFEIICFMSMVINKDINKLFIVGTTITSIYLVWIFIDILKIIYAWIKIDKSVEKQVDVAKLTFIWAIIAFILGLLR